MSDKINPTTTFQQDDEMVDRVITDLQSKFSEAMSKSVPEKIISLKQPDTPILEAGDGYEIILPESYKNEPMIITNPYSDIQEVHFGKMPLSEVFAKQPAKKRIRAIEKAKAKTKRRKANKAAKQSRKK